jgi:hypothetical protein
MRTKRRGIKTCLVVVAVFISLLGIVSMAEAGDFYAALINLFNSSQNMSVAIYYGLNALYLSTENLNGSAFIYEAYVFMNNAASYSSTATSYAYAGYLANPTSWNSYAYQYTNYVNSYQTQCGQDLYSAYVNNNNQGWRPYAIPAMTYYFYADFFMGVAYTFVGTASNGGLN